MSPPESARRGGLKCVRCDYKSGAHDYPNPHPKACHEFVTAAELAEEIERQYDNEAPCWGR